MYKYLLDHEKYILDILEDENIDNFDEVVDYHKEQIKFLQHERIIHLIITIAFAVVLIGVVALSLFTNSMILYAAVIVLIIVEVFYLVHYFRLENGVQRWYELYNKLKNK